MNESDIQPINEKPSFLQIVQNPTTYMLVVAVSLLSVFVYKYTGSNDTVNSNCESEKASLRQQLKEEKDLNNFMILKNMAENTHSGPGDNSAAMLDSFLHEKLEEKTKTILENNK